MKQARIHSREFLGVTLVPFTARKRAASSVAFIEGYFLALAPKGRVVISSDDAFKGSFERNHFVQARIARALLAIEAIDKKTYDAFREVYKAQETAKERRHYQGKAFELEALTEAFGITLTEEQEGKVNSFLKITVA